MSYYEQLKSTTPKVKKERRCFACGIKYPTGTIMHYNVGKFDGEFQTTYSCKPCNSYLIEKREDYEDGIMLGDVWNDAEYSTFRNNYNKKHNLIDPNI